MVSSIDTAKRALVTLLKPLAGIYGLVVFLTRESSDKDLRSAYKKVSRKAHPDHGGLPEHQKALNTSRDAWEEVLVQAARQASPQYGESPESCEGQVSQLEEGLQGGCAEEGRHVNAVI